MTLNKGLGLSHGKCAKHFRQMFGIAISRATSIRSLLRIAASGESAYQDARLSVRRAEWVVPDETG